MALLNVFANFFIDTDERFLRMQDSFMSFKEISADRWVINVRGRYAKDTISFLRKALDEKLIAHQKHSTEGWFHDTREMLADLDGDYVLFWLEDHINLADVELLERIVSEMKDHNLDYMLYTFWQKGLLRERYLGIPLTTGHQIDYFEHNIANNCIIQANCGGSYLISAASILTLSLFSRIVLADDPIPRRWPKETPFDFEKAPSDIHWLPLRVALPRQELFASIDDDHGCNGYCLQARGLYPTREARESYATKPIPHSICHRLVHRIALVVNKLFFPEMRHTPSQWRHLVRLAQSMRPDHLLDACLPQLTFDAIDYLTGFLKRDMNIFEYGSGGSTLFLLKHGACLTSVEHDYSWYHKFQRKYLHSAAPDYRFVHPTYIVDQNRDPSNPDQYASSDVRFSQCSFENYCRQIDEFPDNFFELVLIRGRARPSCIKHSHKKVRIGGLLVLDNSDLDYYLRIAATFLKDYERRIFRGATPSLSLFNETAVFTRKA